MTDATRDSGLVERRISYLETGARRSACLHGLYAAAILLIGLFLPIAQVRIEDDVPVQFSSFGLIFSVATYEFDHPTELVIAMAFVLITALTAAVALFVAASRQNAFSAKAGLVASAILMPIVFVANVVFGYGFIDIRRGSESDPLTGWTAGRLGLAPRRACRLLDRCRSTRSIRPLTCRPGFRQRPSQARYADSRPSTSPAWACPC